MFCDCHMHMVLDGIYWREAIDRHANEPEETFVRKTLSVYREQGFTYLRDGGDRWGVGALARKLAPEYGIIYRTPLAPISQAGHYGGFIGKQFSTMQEYRGLLAEVRAGGGDFVKLMISGLMEFDRFGVLSEDGLDPQQIWEQIHIAHEEGFSVMVHANGARTVEAAAAAGVDSVEHGAYLDEDALAAMVQADTVWVPTLSTVGNLRGKGRYEEQAVQAILEHTSERVKRFAAMGGKLAPGTDAGAWEVPHGSLTEYALLEEILGGDAQAILSRGIQTIQQKF